MKKSGSGILALNGLFSKTSTFTWRPATALRWSGENGQGKTTLIKLLTRLYDPTSGRILLDGVDLREYDPNSLFSQFSVLFQDFMEYDMEVHAISGWGGSSLPAPNGSL